MCGSESCVFVLIRFSNDRQDSFVFVLFCSGWQCWDLYNFIIIEQISICWVEQFLDMSNKFKVMNFTQVNLLHDLLSDKYMFFLIKKNYIKK